MNPELLLAAGQPADTPMLVPGPKMPGIQMLIKETWDLFLARFKKLFIIQVISYSVSIGIAVCMVIAFAFYPSVVSSMTFTGWGILVAGLGIAVIAAMLIQFCGQIATIVALRDPEPAVKESFVIAWKTMKSYTWVMLLMMSIIFGGILLFLIPGILFALWFMFAPYILLNEDIRGMNALLRSKEYMRDGFFGTSWRLIAGLILLSVIMFAISFVLQKAGDTWISSIVSILLSLMATPLTVCYTYIVYHHAKLAKGNTVQPPTRGSRIFFISIALFGIIIVPLIFAGSLWGIYAASLERTSKAKEQYTHMQEKQNLELVRWNLDNYYSVNQRYPETLSALVPVYLDTVPNLQYTPISSGNDYELCLTTKDSRTCVRSLKTEDQSTRT